MSTKSGRESVVKEKVTAADFLAKKAETGGTPADNKRAEAYKKQSEEMKKFLAINESLTEEQREQYQILLDMQATQVARVADASLEL
jgi:signal recognition particle GTPase